MLAQALAVVEAARRLKPTVSPKMQGLWRLRVEPREMREAVRELGEAIEAFDAETGNNRDPVALLVRAIRYASERGVSPEDMVGAIRPDLEEEDVLRDADSVALLRPQPGEVGAPDSVTDDSVTPQLAPRPGRDDPEPAGKYKAPEISPTLSPALEPKSPTPTLAPKVSAIPAPVFGPNLSELQSEIGMPGDTVLAEAGNFAADDAIEMDAISDSLEYAVARFGWTPKLRALAVAWVNTRNRMAQEEQQTGEPRVSMHDALAMAFLSSELAKIENNPELAYEGENDAAPTYRM